MTQERTLRLGIDSTGAKRGGADVSRSLEDIRRTARGAAAATDGVDTSLQRLSRAADALQPVGRKLTMFVTAPLVGIAGFAVKAAADMDSLTRALDAMTGSSAETTRQMERLKDVARAPGLGFREAVQGSVNLQAVGFAALDAERAMKALGNAVATTGGGKGELDRVLFQFAQMAAVGKVIGQDLRPIIQTAPAVAKALNELFGTTSAEAISAQVDSFDEFFNLLIPKLEQMPSVAGGARNAFDNLSDSAFRARAALGDQLLPAVIPLIDGFADMLEAMDGLEPATLRTAIAFGAAAAVIGPLVYTVSSLATSVGLLKLAFGAISPWLAAGSVLIVGLGVLAGLWTKNKLEALEAADAVDKYRESLKDMNMAQLVAQRTALQGQKSSVAEQIANLSGGRGNTSRIAALKQQGMDLVAALQEVDRQILRAGTLNPVVVTVLDGSVENAKTLKKLLEEAADGFLDRWKSLDIARSAAEFARAFQADVRGPIVSDAEMRAFGRGRDAAGRPGQISDTLVQNAGVQQGRIDAARFRELERRAAEAGKAGDSLVRTASDVSRGIIDVADAFGGLDNSTRRALSGITGLIGALDRIDLSKGLGANIGSIAGIVGAVAQIGSAILGQSAALEQNSRALEALRRSLDRPLNRSDEQRAIELIDKYQASTQADKINIWKQNKDLFKALAEDLGLTIDSGDINKSLAQLEEALRLATDRMFEFGNSLEQQRAQQDAYREIFDLTDPKDILGSEYGLLNQFAPELLKQYGAANLNLESEAGRATFEAALREMFTDYTAGTLDKDLLGQFGSGQEFIDLLLQSDRALDAFAKGLDDATRATTDIPKAINLALFRSRITGGGGPATPPDGPAIIDPTNPASPWRPQQPPTAPVFHIGTIVNEAGDTPEDLARKMAKGAQIIHSSGGSLYMPGVRVNAT